MKVRFAVKDDSGVRRVDESFRCVFVDDVTGDMLFTLTLFARDAVDVQWRIVGMDWKPLLSEEQQRHVTEVTVEIWC